MRARDVVGKRIVGVVQIPTQRDATSGVAYTHLDAIVLDDGTRITFRVVETDSGGEYGLVADTHWRAPDASDRLGRCGGIGGNDCCNRSTWVDRKGFFSCATCGLARRKSGVPARPLLKREMAAVRRGEPIDYARGPVQS